MTYAKDGLIEATDFNSLVGGDPITTPNKLNTVWGIGGTKSGYGQPLVPSVTALTSVAASDWANLTNKTANCGSHQGTTLSAVAVPVTGDTITYQANIVTNLNSIYTNSLNAGSTGTTFSNSAVYGSPWSNSLTFVHTATFANGDAARYFFNSGGQLAITCTHPSGGNAVNSMFSTLSTDIGTVVMSAPTTETITIALTPYTGISKIGGSGSPTIDTTKGYYGQSALGANSNVFLQKPIGSYVDSFINILTKTNGTQGAHGDVGSVITIYTVWDEVPDGAIVNSGSNVTLTVRPPESTNISNTWGTITTTTSVTGS